MDHYRTEIKEKLVHLSKKGALLFGTLTCEKLLPHYKFFEEQYRWGDSSVLETSIILLYQVIQNNEKDLKDDIDSTIDAVDQITPNMDGFSDVTASFALDACTAVYSCLLFVKEPLVEHIVDVAIYSRDTVDMFVQEKENVNYSGTALENMTSNDQFMIAEKSRQSTLIERLMRLDDDAMLLNLASLREDKPVIDFQLLQLE
jgi:uncharacterized protein YjaG (DUF416 family)